MLHSERAGRVLVCSLGLEKNNEGWGPITILRVNLKNACKIFFLANSFAGSLLLDVDLVPQRQSRGLSESIRKVSFTS